MWFTLWLMFQMLSMRNGLSLHPMCVPGGLQPVQLSQMRMDFSEGNRSLHLNMSANLPMNQETSTQKLFGLPNQCTASNQALVPNMSNIISSETSFGLEPSMQAHLGPYQLHTSAEVSLLFNFTWIMYKKVKKGMILASSHCSHAKGICKEVEMQHQQTNVNNLEANPLGQSPSYTPYFFSITLLSSKKPGSMRLLLLHVSCHLVFVKGI